MSDKIGVLSENAKVQEDIHPKVFISYSWGSESTAYDFAQRLVSDGVDAIFDKWDLKEGQDKYAFMERCVKDSEIIRVLIVCDKQYAQKADNRTGGVGEETGIISPKIYGKENQEKFIPVIFERDENGVAYCPEYIKSRIHIDLSNKDTYEQEYEKLLRNIYGKPFMPKPKLGKMPEYLDEDKSDYSPIRHILKQIKGATIGVAKRRSCINSFRNEFLEVLKGFYVENVEAKRAYDNFLDTKQLRNFFLDFVEGLAETGDDYADILADIFEELYNKLTCVRTFDPKATSAYDDDVDVFKNIIWELFICVIAYMRNIEDYKSINTMIKHTYFLKTSIFGGQERPTDYTKFRYYSRIIEEEYKPTTEQKNLYTLRGEVVCNQREKLPIYSKSNIAGADLFLYHVRKAFLAGDENGLLYSRPWFPSFYPYAWYWNVPMEWSRMKSKKYCQKMFDLFGVSSIDELKNCVEKCTSEMPLRYPNGCDFAPTIENYIKIEEIGTLN